MNSNQRPRLNSPSQPSESCDSGILNQQILVLVFEYIKWDLHSLCQAASVSRKLRAIANRLLWRELCVYRAPRMVVALANASPNGRLAGGWHALAKLLFFCCGCESTRHFKLSRPLPGHFVNGTRFSKTSGGSFLAKRCRGDTLYVSDPCEHAMANKEDDLGIYRGVFRGFKRSRTRACLVGRQAALEERVRCPYCGTRVWSMTAARLVTKSAARRLGSPEGGLEYFVCVNGHLHGTCWLVPLSSDEGGIDDDDDNADSSGDGDGIYAVGCEDPTVSNGSVSSTCSEVSSLMA
ncbi:EID1-like F-box protein 3 [Cornus florida]|uniref:EID1-like F-box protein 3 n=1 Tax=Cornus florida TaxID=4283 RepID=UPI0028A171D2|nr:EID1-like F-box protein 3 [Cornus florida]